MKIKRNTIDLFVLSLYALFLMNFMGLINIPHTILLLSLLPFVWIEIQKPFKFKKILIVMLIGVFLSMISSLHFREQSLFDTFRASANIFYIFFLLFLINRNYSIETVEKAVIILGVFAGLLYILQFVLLRQGIIILGNVEKALEATSKEGERFRLIGSGIVSLSFFLCLNKTISSRVKIIHIVGILLGLIVTILMGFRTMIAAMLIFSFFLFLKSKGNKRKWIIAILSLVLFISILQIPAVNEMMVYMVEKQQNGDATFDNSDYIRWIQLDYFWNYHFKSDIEKFFGSGLPFVEGGYGVYNQNLYDQGLFWMDWGLLGLSWMIGIIPVVCMLLYSVIVYKTKVESGYEYLGVWFIYLISVSFTTMEFFRPGNFVIQALALYLVIKANDKYYLKK